LRSLVDLVHDCWFDAEALAIDPKTQSIVFRVEPKHSALARGSPRGIVVAIKNVLNLSIQDTERVRDYDINEITFDPTARTISISGGIPITIVIEVAALEIHASSANQIAV